MESLLLGVTVCVFVWLFMRRLNMRRQQVAAARTGSDEMQPKTMPRTGTPGTVTPDQLKALRANNFEPSRLWSREEAGLILDALALGRAAIEDETGESDAPLEVQNKVLHFVLGDDELRASLLDWQRNRTREDEARGALLPKDESYSRIRAYVRELWEE